MPTPSRPFTGSRPRGPALLYCALTGVLVVLIASLAFTSRQPPPPQIAELTPQAQKPISRAPSQLGSAIGSARGMSCAGGGHCTAGAAGGGPGPTLVPPPTSKAGGLASPLDLAAVHQCYGNPPRQISFDTQSPPCVAYWSGANGGATSRGVTGSEVKIAVSNTGDPSNIRAIGDLQSFFNRTFEFYGRSLHLTPASPSSASSSSVCYEEESQADSVEQLYEPFGVTGQDGDDPACYLREAAADRMVTADIVPYFSEEQLASASPYLWQYAMAFDQELQTLGKMACSNLVGRRASYSTDRAIAASTRKFGAILQYITTPDPPSLAPLQSALAKCGSGLAAQNSMEFHEENVAEGEATIEQDSANAVINMKQHGVTTVFCLCFGLFEPSLTGSADGQHYYPEWILSSYMLNDVNQDIDRYWTEPDQRTALLGVTFYPIQLPYADTTVVQAIDVVDPGYASTFENSTSWGYLQGIYWELLQIASGIQMAGPDLTPQSFARGLQLAQFPNPWSPEEEGKVGFAGSSYSMTTDAAMMWWSSTAPSPHADDGPGAWCYVDGGQRFDMSDWPAGPPQFFQGQCKSS